MNTATDERVAILLQMLGTDAADRVLEQLPTEQVDTMKSTLAELQESPPTEDEVDEVLEEFHRFLRYAVGDDRAADHQRSDSAAETVEKENNDEPPSVFVPTDDPFADVLRLQSFQIAGALRDESVPTIAAVLGCLPAPKAGEVIQRLPENLRTAVFLKMNTPSTAPQTLLAQIVRATVEKGCCLDQNAASDPDLAADEKLAAVLRSLDRSNRNVMLEALEEADQEKAARIKDMLYVFTDLQRTADRSVQKLLAEVDSVTLATALKNADQPLVDKITNNLSKRARATLLEEIEFMGSVSSDQQQTAEKMICDVLGKLDQAGDLEITEE